MAETKAPILRPPDVKADSLEKIMMPEKTEGTRRKGRQKMRCLYSIADSMVMNLRKL